MHIMSKGTILIGTNTRERLKQLGKKGQTYDQLICELISNSYCPTNMAERGLTADSKVSWSKMENP
jgi:hypothetical protein